MTKRKKTNLKIIGATAVALFSLTSLFTGTVAWFSMNQGVTATGMGVKAAKQSNINILSCYAVRYDGNYGAIAYDISGGNSNIAMSEYDYVFTDRNVNTPLFIRMEIANFNPENDLTITIPCTGNYKTDGKVEPNLSNVVGAKLLYGLKVNSSFTVDNNTWTNNDLVQGEDGIHTTAVVNSYRGMLANAHENDSTPFVDIEHDSKSNSIRLSLDAEDVFDENFIVTRKDAQNNDINVAIAYVVFDYYVDEENDVNLVTDYLESYEEEEHELSFTSDISTMALANEGD